jgi:hypothetical protein
MPNPNNDAREAFVGDSQTAYLTTGIDTPPVFEMIPKP